MPFITRRRSTLIRRGVTVVFITYAATGALGLPPLTVSGTGTFTPPVYTGSGDLALPALTVDGTGAHTTPVYTGSGALTIPPLTVAGTGAHTTPTYTGSGDMALPALTVAGTGAHTTPVYTGSGALTVPPLTVAGTGAHTTPVYTATGALALPPLTVAGTGAHTTPVYTGSGDMALPPLTVAGTGQHVPLFTGSGDVVLPALTVAGTGAHTTPVYTGTGALTLPPLTVAGTGAHTTPTYTGSGDMALPPLTVAGTGAHTTPVYTGSGALTLPPLTVAGTGAFTPPVYTGSGDMALPALTVAGTGAFVVPTYTGTGALVLPPLTVAGTGAHTTPVYTGTGALTLPPLTAAGTGAFTVPTYTGSGDMALPPLTAAGTGAFVVPVYTGAGDVALPALVLNGTGLHAVAVFSGTGDVGLPPLTLSGAGAFVAPPYTGAGVLSLPPLGLEGSGAFVAPVYTGAGALVLPALTTAGTGGAVYGPLDITPSPASAVAALSTPTIIFASLTLIPNPASVVASAPAPTVILAALVLAPGTARATAAVVAPSVVFVSLDLLPNPVSAAAKTVAPSVILGGLVLMPSPAHAVAAVVAPGVIATAVLVTPSRAHTVAAVSTPTRVLVSLVVIPSPARARAVVPNRRYFLMPILDSDWPQLGRNPQRQGYSPVTVAGPYSFAWKWFEVPFSGRTQPVIVTDKLYIGSIDGKMYCRNAITGAAVWNYDTGGPIRHTAAVEGTRCFVTSMSGKLFSLHATTGAHQWDADIGPSATAVLLDVENDRVFACSLTGVVACYSQAGTLEWQVQMGGAVMTSPSLSEDGTALFGASEDMFAWSLDAATGARRWMTKLSGVSAHSRAPVVTGTSVMYRVQPFEQFHKLLQEGGDTVMALAGSVNSNWATDWAAVKPYIVSHLNANPHRQTFHVLHADTGVSKATAPVLYCFGHNGIPASPIVTPTGIYVEYRARHGIQTDTPTTHVTSNYDAEFGVMDASTFDITGLNTVASLANRQWRATSDEPAGITKGGDILWIESWERIGGINLAAGNQSGTNIFLANLASEVNTAHDNYTGVGEGGQSRAYGSFFPLANDSSPSRPWPKNLEGEGHEIAGPPIASGAVFWKAIGGGLACIKPTSQVTSTQIHNAAQTGAGTASSSNSGRAMSEFVTIDFTTPNNSPPTDLRDLLRHEVMDMVRSSAGHLLCFWMQRGLTTAYAWPTGHAGEITVIKDGVQGNAFWFDPAELLYTCAMAYPYLTTAQQARLKTWVEAEIGRFDPLTDLPYPSGGNDWLHTGKSRMPYADPTRANLSTFPSPKFHLASFYAIWLWCKNTGDWSYCDNNQTLMRSQYTAFKTDLRYYANIAGLIGYARIAAHLVWTDAASSATTATTALTNSTGFSTFDSRAGADYKDYFYNDNGGVNPEDMPVFWGLVPEIGLYLAEKTSGAAKQRILNHTNWTGGLPGWWFTKGGTAHKYLSENGFMAPHAAWSGFLARAYVMGDDQTTLRKVFDPSRWAMGDLYLIQRIVALIQAPA